MEEAGRVQQGRPRGTGVGLLFPRVSKTTERPLALHIGKCFLQSLGRADLAVPGQWCAAVGQALSPWPPCWSLCLCHLHPGHSFGCFCSGDYFVLGRHPLPPRLAWGHPTPHVSGPSAAGHACPVGRATETGHGATVAAWTPPHAWWPPTKSGRLLQSTEERR